MPTDSMGSSQPGHIQTRVDLTHPFPSRGRDLYLALPDALTP